ncbi:unnamed protein product [Peronospora destructor]|uniref:Uncharacterized protein n=1 Tax=Peronospora destructor TaxID=86335 RepID=A0AAV0UBZ6_9STRA|nr:unnamed protein product [Peronospora destructor]
MGKKKSPSSLGGGEVTKETSDDGKKSVIRIARLFTTMQKKGSDWNRREREGIKLIEEFQLALLALRDAQTVAPIEADREKEEAIVLDRSGEQERSCGMRRGGDQQVEATQLRPVDYLQMMSQELATFEAEYQHIEALLRLISFETSTDELRTLVISWTTSPFLYPAQTRCFLQRHLLSNQLHT